MKKTVLMSFVLFAAFALAACDNKENTPTYLPETTTVDPVCIQAVEDYLAWATKWKWDEAKNGDNIVVDYIGRLEDGSVFDTSIESIAQACGSYSDYRDYTSWLEFEVWAWQMIKWFDKGVVGMKVGETKTLKFGPEEWYGLRNEDYVVTYPFEEGMDPEVYVLGSTVCVDQYTCGAIVNKTDKEMTVDFNHNLAWKDLIFDVTLKSIN